MGRKVEYSDSSISCVSYFMISTKKYNKGHTHQASFEENIVDLMAKAYTPLSLVYFRELEKLISSLDTPIDIFLQSRLSINFIPLKYEAFRSDMMNVLNNCLCVVLIFYLCMSVKNEDFFNVRPSFR